MSKQIRYYQGKSHLRQLFQQKINLINKQESQQVGNFKKRMQKVPPYIGVFVQDNKSASKQIKNYIRQGVTQLLQAYDQPEITNQIYDDLNNFQQTFKPPGDNYHLTNLFIGGNAKNLSPKQTKILENYKPNQKAILKMDCIIYIPGYILCAYNSDTDGIEVDNKFPHVTLFLANQAKAVQSNMVIQALALKNPQIFDKKQLKTGRYDIEYNKFKNVFVINKRLELKGVTGSNFTHGKR